MTISNKFVRSFALLSLSDDPDDPEADEDDDLDDDDFDDDEDEGDEDSEDDGETWQVFGHPADSPKWQRPLDFPN